MKNRFVWALMFVLACMIATAAQATLVGTVPTAPGATVVPGLTSDSAGTLLASISSPVAANTGTFAGTLVTAVFIESGGTLDFYYQITNDTIGPSCGFDGAPACDPLTLETSTSFFGFSTSVGFRTDGASLPGGIFANGTVSPVSADRNSVGDVVGFQFSPPDSAKIQPGQSSNVLVISTNATNLAAGSMSVNDGGFAIASAFEPASPRPLTIGKAFGAATIPLDGTTSLTFQIVNLNLNPSALTGVAFSDNLPPGLVVAAVPDLFDGCGGTATAAAGSGTISLSNGIARTGPCNVSVNVTGTMAGVKNNTTGNVTWTGGTGNMASASITVVGPTSTPVPTLNESGMLIFGLLIAAAGLLLLIRKR